MDFLPDLLEQADPHTAADKIPLAPTLATALRLKPEFVLDGTHMNPSYLHLVEAAINKVPLAKKGKK